MKKFYIRVDASPVIGSGHFVRCVNLAKSLIRRGAEITFVSRNLGGDLIKRAIEAKCQIINLSPQKHSAEQNPDRYETWLGAEERDDITECLDLMRRNEDFSIIVDHYGVNEEWLRIAKEACRKLIVLDDLAERRMDVDIIINQNLGWTAADYVHLVQPTTKLLLGPQYAIVDQDYSTVRQKLDRSFKGEAPLRVLISLGGADIENVSGKVARVLEEMQRKHDFVVTIVVGSMNPNSNDLHEICQRSSGKIGLIQGVNNLVDAYVSHDIAVGAVGGSSWERCCLGLPTVLVPIADNQMLSAKRLDDAGAGILVDNIRDQFELKIFRALNRLFYPEVREEISHRAFDICDGLGGKRIANEIMSN